MQEDLDYKKNILKGLVELNSYAIIEKIDKINNFEELKSISDRIEKYSKIYMKNIGLCNG